MAKYNYDNLDSKTVAELRELCAYDLDISGMWKQRKDTIIKAILAKTTPKKRRAAVANPTVTKQVDTSHDVNIVGGTFTSEITAPDARIGSRISTTIRVSCGASSGDFPVVGKTVGAVGEFLKEVLNVETLARGLVNGTEVDGDYLLKQGDQLEYLKPAGKKG